MALRVLLADESTTIKKVMQLALQDFAVEVKAVHAGVDVLEVARAFKPDLIFVDVLLQKKNGYEVATDLKKDPELKSVPVVLIWSSFMDLDENLAKQSGAEKRLEKPFDAQQLRQIVLELVPRTRSQRLAHFLDFPKIPGSETKVTDHSAMPPLPDKPPPLPKIPAAPAVPTAPATPAAPAIPVPPSENWNMDSFKDISDFDAETSAGSDNDSESEHEEFAELRIAPPSPPPQKASEDDESWSHQDLSRFQIVLPATSVESENVKIQITPSEQTIVTEKPEPTLTGVQGLSLGDYRDEHLPSDSAPAADDDPDGGSRAGAHDFSEELSLVESIEDMKYRRSQTAQMAKDEPLTRTPAAADESIPEMTADRLEQILRVQSREIIEDFVRRVLPDLAGDIIRAELQRLLEEGPQ